VAALDDWKVFYYRSDAWTNPLSSDGAPPPPKGNKPAVQDFTLPDGVRLVLTLPAGDAIGGTLTRDWVRISLGGGKS
jgi:general secretion pathway protein J